VRLVDPFVRSFPKELVGNLAAGLRLAVFISPRSLTISWGHYLALLVANVTVVFLVDMTGVGLAGQINVYGLPGALFGITLALLVAVAIAVAWRRTDYALALLVTFAALAIPVETTASAVSSVVGVARMGRFGFYFHQLPYYWFALAAAVAAARLLPVSMANRAAIAAIVLIAIGLPTATIYRDHRIWIKAYNAKEAAEQQARYMALAQEELYYLQPQLLEREIGRLEKGNKGKIDLYFVGAAGWAGQDVFMKEVVAVNKLFEERFGARGRTIRLVNNAKTAADLPIASVTSLERALQAVGQAMDRDEDVLFLFMTSHGSRDHRFSLEFWPLRFKELTPAVLREMLDASGIRRRVIVVSACYSGGFLDALKDDNTVVITAASPDRNSFGCSNEAEFTYFGKAYFDEALRKTYSFIDAFEIARPVIEQREKQENYAPSGPLIFVGRDIRAPLQELEQILQAPRPSTATGPSVEKDAYAQFSELWLPPDVVAQYREECMRNMSKVSPAHYVDKDPTFFGGLNRSSHQWPQLMLAWQTYSEEYCRAANDPAVHAELYRQGWRSYLAPHEVGALANFLHTPLGQRFVAANGVVNSYVTSHLIEATAPATDQALKKYQAAQLKITADFQREQTAGNK